jgi:hypothetical protein
LARSLDVTLPLINTSRIKVAPQRLRNSDMSARRRSFLGLSQVFFARKLLPNGHASGNTRWLIVGWRQNRCGFVAQGRNTVRIWQISALSPNFHEWVEPLNWVGGAVPNGTATFNNASVTTVANDNGGIMIGTILFTAAPNAQAYTVDFNNPAVITALGIVNNSTNLQTFNVASGSSMVFQNASSASGGTGAVTINNTAGGFLVFQNTSTAGTATIVNSAIPQFNDTSTAGSAHVTNNSNS